MSFIVAAYNGTIYPRESCRATHRRHIYCTVHHLYMTQSEKGICYE